MTWKYKFIKRFKIGAKVKFKQNALVGDGSRIDNWTADSHIPRNLIQHGSTCLSKEYFETGATIRNQYEKYWLVEVPTERNVILGFTEDQMELI
jgi:hypothetical protein